MHRVDRPALQRLEELARRHDLIGVEQLDLKLALGGRVDRVDDRLGHVLAQRRAGIGLEPPPDRLLRHGPRRGQTGDPGRGAKRARARDELSSVAPGHVPYSLFLLDFVRRIVSALGGRLSDFGSRHTRMSDANPEPPRLSSRTVGSFRQPVNASLRRPGFHTGMNSYRAVAGAHANRHGKKLFRPTGRPSSAAPGGGPARRAGGARQRAGRRRGPPSSEVRVTSHAAGARQPARMRLRGGRTAA